MSESARTRVSSKRELTGVAESLYCSGRLNEAVHDVPSPRRTGASRADSYPIRFDSRRRPLARVGGFFTPSRA
jgi:hypothetical protein